MQNGSEIAIIYKFLRFICINDRILHYKKWQKNILKERIRFVASIQLMNTNLPLIAWQNPTWLAKKKQWKKTKKKKFMFFFSFCISVRYCSGNCFICIYRYYKTKTKNNLFWYKHGDTIHLLLMRYIV